MENWTGTRGKPKQNLLDGGMVPGMTFRVKIIPTVTKLMLIHGELLSHRLLDLKYSLVVHQLLLLVVLWNVL